MYTTTDFENAPSFDTFNMFWFVPESKGTYCVYYEGMEYGRISVDIGGRFKFEPINPDNAQYYQLVSDDFNRYKSRPEYLVGRPIAYNNIEEAITIYEQLLTGVALIKSYMRYKVNPDKHIHKVQSALDWLRSTDFYNAPASTIYHDAYVSGLLVHSLAVYNAIVELQSLVFFKSCSVVSQTLTALVHDWCKIGLYTPYKRNVKNEDTGRWEQVDAFKRNDPDLPLGHGVSSMYKAMRIFSLSVDEAMAIRWHMGVWNVSPNEMSELQLANEQYPLVHMLQFADQLSITRYAKE